MLPQIAPLMWALLAFAALLVGFSKTAVPGINTIAIAIFAAILPAKESTGALLILLIVGDMFALFTYRRYADWRTLLRLVPAVAAGLALGAVFLAFASDGWVRRAIGAILLLVIAATLWQRARTARTAPVSAGSAGAGSGTAIARSSYGALGGFTTMVANAGGPVMSMYFLAARFEVKAFLGTAAWFFAVINLAKLPVSVGLGLIHPGTLLLDLVLIPGVVVGALIGTRIAARMKQQTFDWAVIVCTVLGALYLLVG